MYQVMVCIFGLNLLNPYSRYVQFKTYQLYYHKNSMVQLFQILI